MQMKCQGVLIFFIAIIFSVASNNSIAQQAASYTSQWKKVEELVSKNLTKSALTEVMAIYNAARREQNDAQLLKSLIYRVNLSQNLEEDAEVKTIAAVEMEIDAAKEPAKSVLYSIAAELYWDYFSQNRYKLYSRMSLNLTDNYKNDDIRTWSASDFHKKIGDLYLASLKNYKLIQQIKLEKFEPVIVKGNTRNLRPTLFDLLAHRALSYFTNDERDILKPSYAFTLSDTLVFAPYKEFISHKFFNKDSLSLHYYALTIFQRLIAFHGGDPSSEALLDADIERIIFAKQYGVMQDKTRLYINALRHIQNSFENNPTAAEAGYLIAQEIYNQATSNSSDTLYTKYSIQQSKQIAENVTAKFPTSEGGVNAKNLLNSILHKELSLTTEKVNLPGMPFRMLVTYRNINSVTLRIILLTPELKKSLENNQDNDLWKKLTTEKYIKSWKQSLPTPADYKQHSTEIKIDQLPLGEYAIVASAADDFGMNKNPLAAQYLYISNISYVNNGAQYFVLHRESGKPLEHAVVQVWSQKYDYSTSKNILEKGEHLSTDKNGFVKLSPYKKNQNRDVRLEITWNNDRLFLSDYQYNYTYYSDDDYRSDAQGNKTNTRIFLFTDRSIYRPGQLVYFKGIGIINDSKTRKPYLLATREQALVTLSDANNQVIDSLKLSINDFGSFNGKFRLPANQLNGSFTIAVKGYNYSSISFSVEEYKRPKFYADFEKLKGTYRINDKITVIGFAKSYTADAIDGANVRYRVTRIARFLYPWMFWRIGFPQSQSMEITNGETKTDANGKFIIAFDAIPDPAIDKKTDPVFDFRVEADITDKNGETRSGSLVIPISYKAVQLNLNLPENAVLNADSLREFSVTTKNMNDEFEAAKVDVKIYSLKAPDRLIRPRYWQQPDQFIMTKEEYLKYFPLDEYSDETKKETWARDEMVYSKIDSNLPGKKFKIQKLKQGWYVAEVFATDKYGQQVKDIKYFQLFEPQTKELPSTSYFWMSSLSDRSQPGQTASFITGTSAHDVFMMHEVDRRKSVQSVQPYGAITSDDAEYKFYSLSNEKKKFDFSISEEDRGGFGVVQFFVKDNRFFSGGWNVDVPWTNKQLDVTYETFRDKVLPGSDEKWKVKISGEKAEKVAAEMLVSMYDASLDQFKPHTWSIPDIWPKYYDQNMWASNQNFSAAQSFQKWWEEDYTQQKEKVYDELLPINIGNHGVIYSMAPRNADLLNKLSGKVAGIQTKELRENDVAAQVTSSKIQNDTTFVTAGLIDQSQIQIRKNFDETAFFFPELRTDENGVIEFGFTVPEALTQWKLMTFAHTKDLSAGYSEQKIVTKKDLMVQPNPPRFIREGDKIQFTVKIVNSGPAKSSGEAELKLFDAITMKSVDEEFNNNSKVLSFNVDAGQSTFATFNLAVPKQFTGVLMYRLTARTAGNSDGEEAIIPVLTNRMLVIETLPLTLRGYGTKDFKFEKLLTSGSSSTLQNHSVVVEYTANPAWYAIQALPYLAEEKYQNTEEVFNRYFANSLAEKIASSSPKIKAVFEKWKTLDTAALLSNLQKNQELKSLLLEETPWVMEANDETEQKKNIALLFDMVHLSGELSASLAKVKDMQSSNGGFVWYKGGPDDRYMTQYIVTSIGHLKKLNARNWNADLRSILQTALPYLDAKITHDYDELISHKQKLSSDNLNNYTIQYLYMRSYFPEYPVNANNKKAYDYYREQVKKYWVNQTRYMQAMISLALDRTNDHNSAVQIIKALKENSINNEELGMYWKEWANHGYWWYQAPIESQALMIEAFSEIENDTKTIDDLKTWLLKNKQTTNWKTSKATAEACYALLLQGTDWLSEDRKVQIGLGSTTISSTDPQHAEAGTGYFKQKIPAGNIKPEMGNIHLTIAPPNNNSSTKTTSTSWGAVYWQYFENLDKISFSETPLKIEKKLFIEKNSDRGPVLNVINDGSQLHIGDKIKVRIEITVDRDMEYVHMKDMRASCMEPVNVLSGYKWQGGLGYYETTKDASTNFFFPWLTRGKYVFEYPLFVTHAGDFSNGITTIQSMYAPEFTAHSEGTRVSVRSK